MPIYLKGLWHASAHVRQLDFCSGEQFFKIGVWWRNPLPSTLRRPRKPWYQYSRAIWSIWEVLNAIFCIFVQVLSRKFEVIEENRTTHAHYRNTVPLMKRQRGLSKVSSPAHNQVDASLPWWFHHQVSFCDKILCICANWAWVLL